MKFSEDMRYPHPVLTPESGDIADATFGVRFICEEALETSQVRLRYNIELTQPDIVRLVTTGQAGIGAFVRCQDTYYSAVIRLDWPTGIASFPPGSLVNRVTVRPIIWAGAPLSNWAPVGLNPEFGKSVSTAEADLIAIGLESVLQIGRAKLAPLETIFSIQKSADQPEGQIKVMLDSDRITIICGEATFGMVNRLRGDSQTRSAALSGIYLPAVMEVLDAMRDEAGSFEGRRWYNPFMSKCDVLGINVADPNLLEDAQRLLRGPVGALEALVEG